MPVVTSDAVFEERMREAEASKQAGNAALAAGNAKSASFHYKKVYLHLAEYLPADMAASALASASSSPPPLPASNGAGASGGGDGMSDDDAANGLVGFLQQRRRKEQKQRERDQEDAEHAALDAQSRAEASKAKADAEAERKQRLYALYGSTLNNLTLANYKLGRYREGVATASCLLNRIPSFELSPKALLRRGYCYVGLQEPNLAEVDAKELERIVRLASERCTAESGAAEGDGAQRAASEVIEGLGGMPVAAVAGMSSEVAALQEAIRDLKRATEENEKRMYRKMFAAQ